MRESDPQVLGKGFEIYQAACAKCHGVRGEGREKIPAVMGEGVLKRFRDDDAALFRYVKRAMPQDGPGSLSDEEYLLVLAALTFDLRNPPQREGAPGGVR